MTRFFLHENRDQVFSELKALKQLSEIAPHVSVMPGHDGEVMASLVEKGVFVPGFK